MDNTKVGDKTRKTRDSKENRKFGYMAVVAVADVTRKRDSGTEMNRGRDAGESR